MKFQKGNWLELPSDVMANILQRVGVLDILENAQKVCTSWRKICKDPAMWRVVYMENHDDPNARPTLREMCKHVVDRSQGQLVDLTIVDFADDELLEYIADRSSQLRSLEFDACYGHIHKSWEDALKKFPLLEEPSLYITDISKEALESAGSYCPMLTTLKVNEKTFCLIDDENEQFLMSRNEIAIAIGENLHELRHLELIGNSLSNDGLKVIRNGCRHLELLDLHRCFFVDLKGHFGKTCSENIKCLKLPNDSLEGCPFIFGEYPIAYHAFGFHEIIEDDDDDAFGFHEIIDNDDDDV